MRMKLVSPYILYAISLYKLSGILMKEGGIRKESKAAGAAGAASAGGSIAGAHNVCHALCLGAVAFLSVFGISASSTALMFLEDFALPFWIMGLAFLALSLAMLIKYGKCISRKLIVFNAGLLFIGVPFFQKDNYAWAFWLAGSIIAIYAVLWFLNDRYNLKLNKIKGG